MSLNDNRFMSASRKKKQENNIRPSKEKKN